MSGSGNKKRSSGRSQGWEEAGGEFYSESYPSGADADFEIIQKDASRLATLLPSKQSRFATIRTGTGTTTTRYTDTRTRTFCHRTATRSWQSTARRASTFNQDIQVSMLPDLSENLSNEQTTWQEIMLVKSLPIPMSQKKELKAKLQNATYLRLQGCKRIKWCLRKKWQSMYARWSESLAKLQLWRGNLKTLESQVGTGVVSYFHFIKWLMFFNLKIFAPVLLLLFVPKIFIDNTSDAIDFVSDTNDTVWDVMRMRVFFDLDMLFYGNFALAPVEFARNDTNTSDVFTNDSFTYNVTLAYTAMIFAVFISSLGFILKVSMEDFKQKLIQSQGYAFTYCNCIFTAWDFCIKTDKIAELKHNALYGQIRNLIHIEHHREDRANRTGKWWMKIIILRFSLNFIYILVTAGCGVLVFAIIHICHDLDADNPITSLALAYAPYILIVILNAATPTIFKCITKLERYATSFAARILLIRMIFLRLFLLAVVFVAFYDRVTCANTWRLLTTTVTRECQLKTCWETYVGREICKIIISDCAWNVFLAFFVNFPRAFIARHVSNKCMRYVGEQKFVVDEQLVDVIYIQTLVWIGFVYAPILPLFAAVVYFFLFYLKRFVCLHNSKRDLNDAKASANVHLYRSVLFVCFVAAAILVTIALYHVHPSKCGPFAEAASVWSYVTGLFEQLPTVVTSNVKVLSDDFFLLAIILLLSFSAYYLSIVNDANKQMVGVLRNQLILEGHDKQFLLDRLTAFIKQQQDCQKKMRNLEMLKERDRVERTASST